MASDVALLLVGPEQQGIAEKTAQPCQQHRHAAAQAQIQEPAAGETADGASQGRQGQPTAHLGGREIRLVEHHGREIEHASCPEARHQAHTGQLPQRRGKLVPPLPAC